jgi:hypothetical protein
MCGTIKKINLECVKQKQDKYKAKYHVFILLKIKFAMNSKKKAEKKISSVS